MKVLSLFDKSGNMVRPWADAGHDCTIVDLQHPEGVDHSSDVVKVGADLHTFYLAGSAWDIIFAFPPCTHLANSGNRWKQAKGLPAVIEALQLVNVARSICEDSGRPYMIENPVGSLSTYWRQPDYLFDPYEYGGYSGGSDDTYSKRTCLWTGGGFVMPNPLPVDNEGSRMHLLPPSPDRANQRSVTPMGFAQAVYEANCHSEVPA